MPIIFIIIAMAQSLIKRELSKVIKRFKFEELENAVMPIFPEISWTHVRTKLIKSHKSFTTINALHMIEEAIKNIDLRLKDLEDRLLTLEVTDVSRHDKKKIWYSFELTHPNEPVNYIGKRDMQKNIKEEFKSIGLDMNVKVLTYDNIMFIYISKKGNQQKRPLMRIFFALFLGHKYLFCSKKNVSDNFIKVVAVTLGYKDSKRLKLTGKDLRSLIRLLWIKQQGVVHHEDINQSTVYGASKPVIKDTGVDFIQSKQRRKYAEQCFGKNPPTLESLVVQGPSVSVQHKISSLLPTNNMHMNWEFRSHNLARFLTNLAEKRVFMPSLPDYVSNFMTMGKNQLKLRTD